MLRGNIYRVRSDSEYVIPDRIIVMCDFPERYYETLYYASIFILLGTKRYSDQYTIPIPAGMLFKEECAILPNINAWVVSPPKEFLIGKVPRKHMGFLTVFDRNNGFRLSDRLVYSYEKP